MYAAAGGASLASRQARQKQRQQKKTQQLQAKLHPPKASTLSVADTGASTPTRTSRQFHQLPTGYLRAPTQPHGRKLSASYTTQSKLLLPIDEGGDTQSVLHMRMHSHAHGHAHHAHSHSHAHAHHHQQQLSPLAAAATPPPPAVVTPLPNQHYSYTGTTTHAAPKLVHRHSGSGTSTSFQRSHLPKSATATLPLVSQMEATPPTTPLGVGATGAKVIQTSGLATMAVPHDSIIVTPATPIASPGHEAKQRDELPDTIAEKQPLTAAAGADAADDDGDGDGDDEEPMVPPTGPLERKCSVYRMRRSDAFEQDSEELGSIVGGGYGYGYGGSGGGYGGGGAGVLKLQLLNNQQQQQYEPLLSDEPHLLFKGLPNGRKWQVCAYCEEGICVCEHIECAQGRAAWLERGRRCSVQESQERAAACHRRWVKRNRIQDASLGGSSDDEDFLSVLRGPSTFANAFLYVGLGTIALGLVIAFVGTGEKGFKTVELRLIGPSLIGLGLICCILRILFCICPSHCIASGKKARKKAGNKVDADHTTSLLRGESKRVSIARSGGGGGGGGGGGIPNMQPKYPITHKRSNSKMLNEGMEALRQIATTSLFMQNEQKPALNRIVPIIKEPENTVDAPFEMKKLDTALNVCELSDEEDEDDENRKGRAASMARRVKIDNTPAELTAVAANSRAAAPTTTTTIAHTSSHRQQINSNNKTNNNNTNHNNRASTTIAGGERPPTLSSAGKLARQRVAINQQQPAEPSQSLSSSSTVKDSIDEEQLIETTSRPISAPATVAPPPTTTNSATASTVVAAAAAAAAAGAESTRLTSLFAASSVTTTCVSATPFPPPPAYSTGAISRVSTSTSHGGFDLPPATPHTYANALASSRSAGERESLIRGPLGMPLSVLTASSSTYAFATPPAPPASAPAPTTTTTISLLPLPAPPPATTAPLANNTNIPGQVMEAAATATSAFAPHTRFNSPTPGVATTSLSIRSNLTTSSLQPSAAAPPIFASAGYKFPAPLTSSSASASSSASSNGRMAALAAPVASSFGIALAPPAAPPSTGVKFEPELLLSPAKLGQ